MCAPGNAGTLQNARNLAVRADDLVGLVGTARAERADLVVVGPEAPLVAGLADALAAEGIAVFGPTRAAARLEGSKAFMKQFLKRHAIPTAAFEVFDSPELAIAHARAAGRPLVVKTDGLAAGKGVVVPATVEETVGAIEVAMVKRAFGDAGRTVILEERLAGEEASFHVICDGNRALALASAQDHKRAYDGDHGPNTGGMGAYAPAPLVTPAIAGRVMDGVVLPTLAGMRAEGCPFMGVLFVGLMIDRGEPTVLEFNVRFGDPEACVIFPLLEGDPGALLDAAARGALGPEHEAMVRPSRSALAVVMAAEKYPANPRLGDPITGLSGDEDDAFVCHAGTRVGDGGRVVTSGGRVLTVVGLGPTLPDARDKAYERVGRIQWPGEHHRTDIGHRAL
jgi:phosphoribosylamine--glycine ligase